MELRGAKQQAEKGQPTVYVKIKRIRYDTAHGFAHIDRYNLKGYPLYYLYAGNSPGRTTVVYGKIRQDYEVMFPKINHACSPDQLTSFMADIANTEIDLLLEDANYFIFVEAKESRWLARSSVTDLQIEYPVAGSWMDGQLASGYIDLVALEDGRVDIIDFKTDTPPPGSVEQTHPKYASQVRIYGKLLETAGILKDRHLRCGLLFTADGSIRWIDL
ncbi:MAG TPA: PD-(D/E)XK nuclease family protein [Terriglobales bacterium]|nr:PD-(D/E)XK nuclease family protein [Terriglobales bacterium]